MKILLLYSGQRRVLPGRHIGTDTLINPKLKDVARLCYEVCDENRKWITAPPGRNNSEGHYVESPEESVMRLKLQQALAAKKLTVVKFRTPDNRVRFEAVRAFPCEVEVELEA